MAAVLHMFTGLAGGFGYTALFAILSISPYNNSQTATKLLTSVGKRSLTFYLYQETMLVILLSPVALGLGGVINGAGAFGIAILIWVSGIILAVLLERKSLQGPADALLRKLVYK